MAKKEFILRLSQSMDRTIPFGTASNGCELLEVFNEKLGYWVIIVDEIPVGIFGIDVCSQLPQRWQTSTFILKGHRGKAIGPLIKLATVQVFLKYCIPLVCLVRNSNTPSLNSLERTFPELVSRDYLHIDKVQFHVFNLSMISVKAIPTEAENVASVLDSWLRARSNAS